MLTLWILWAVLTISIVFLAVARKIAARNEDDLLHLSGGAANLISQQTTTARRLDWFDQWGKRLTIIDGAFFVLLVAIMLFTAWRESVTLGN
jgi:hypothetical protein